MSFEATLALQMLLSCKEPSLNDFQRYNLAAARVLVAAIFLANGFGIIPQTLAAKDLATDGTSAALVPLVMLAGRTIRDRRRFRIDSGYLSPDCGNRLDCLPGASDAHGPCLLAGSGYPGLFPAVPQFPEEHLNDGRAAVHCGDVEPTQLVSTHA
jgi:hypothetical protein